MRKLHTGLVVMMLGGAVASLAACGDGGGDLAITDLDPRSGALTGEQPIRILGANFRPDVGYTVYFGPKRASSVTVIDQETLLAVTPEREEPGPVDVTVLADNGPAFRISQGFAYRDTSVEAEAAQKTKGNLAY